MPKMDRLGITLSLVMLGLLLSVLVPLPSREVRLVLLGSELGLHISGPTSLAVILVALACAGVDTILASHPQYHPRHLGHHVPFWMLPGLLVIVVSLFLGNLWWGYQVMLILCTTLALALIIVFQYYTVDLTNPRYNQARLTLNVITYAGMLLLLLFLYGMRLRSLLSATGTMVAAGALAVELFRGPDQKARRIWLYGAVVGLVLGELTWALNYYIVDVRLGSAFLFLVFYTLTGLVQQHLWGRLNRRVALEYGIVCATGLVALGMVGMY